MPRSDTCWWATIRSVRSGASVTDGYESVADTSSGSSRPPTPASSVASTSRSGPCGSGGSAHVKLSGKWKSSSGSALVVERDHRVLEAEQHPRVDLEREVEVDRALAPLLGVEVDLPRLAQRVALDEVALVVHVETVLDRVVLEIGDEAGDVDDCHVSRRAYRTRGAAPVADAAHRVAARVERGRQPEEARGSCRRSGGARPATPASRSRSRVGLALVAQRVVLGGDHDRRRDAARGRARAAARSASRSDRRSPPV